MSHLKFFLPALILVGGIVVPSTASFGKAEYTRTEKVKCAVCHTQGKNLNKVGECYKTKKDLKACQAN